MSRAGVPVFPRNHPSYRPPVREECSFELCQKTEFLHGLCRGHVAQEARGQELRPLRSYIRAS
jgi:hypothetical protein